MKKVNSILFIVLLALTSLVQGQEINPSDVKNAMKQVANWQIAHYSDLYSGHKKPHHPLDWTNGALYVGMVKWAAMADDDTYYNWLKDIGNQNEWKLHSRKYHADDHTVGQMYLELYGRFKDEKMIEPTKEQFNFIMYHPAQTSLEWRTPYHQSRWNWCDALFMSPPVWAKLYKITGERKYLDFMMEEYKATTDFVFDKKEHLYYRDQSFMGKLNNGTKIFWSRGNGWVFAGLTNIMNELNPNGKEYRYFLKIYKKKAEGSQGKRPATHLRCSLIEKPVGERGSSRPSSASTLWALPRKTRTFHFAVL